MFLKFKIEFSLIDMIKILSMNRSESKISFSVENYDEKTGENYRNFYVIEKRIISKLSKISIKYFNSTNRKLE